MSDTRPLSDDDTEAGRNTIRLLKDKAPSHLKTILDEQIANLPRRYFKTISEKDMHDDLTLIYALGKDPIVVITPVPPLVMKVLIKSEMPNKFLFVAGALAKQSIGVAKAAIFSGLKDRLTLSYYEFAGEVDMEVAQKAVRDLKKSLSMGMPCMPMLYRPDNDGMTITFNHLASTTATVVTIQGRDQIGFLFRIATVLSDLKLQLLSAEISTQGLLIRDHFSVVNGKGDKLSAEESETLKQRLLKVFTP